MTPRAAVPTSSATIWALLSAIVGVAWLGGAALPMAWGWLPALGVAVVAALVTRSRLGSPPVGGWGAALRARGSTLRFAVVFSTGFVAVVFAAVLATGVGQLLVGFPGATFAVAFTLVAALVLDRVPRFMAWAMAPIIVALAVIGARFEAAGPDARGAAFSGPILGIHPFQSTAVLVDGWGPFDLPINDFVEPNGSRGYDPAALATALELALHRIAEVHFAAGPVRAREAFANARVEFLRTPPVRERLDTERPPPVASTEPGAEPSTEPMDPRFVVYSGTTGQRSRVEFVCPGRRDDPRGARPEAVMSRTCPTKYASEASAGLGVTGRWPGYAEWRGNERLSLAQWFGVTRLDAPAGADWIARERWLYGTIVLTFVLAVALLRRGAPAIAMLARAGPVAVPLVALVLLAAWTHSDLALIEARATAPPWMSWMSLQAWQGALVWPAVATMLAWSEPELRVGGISGRGRAALVVLVLVWFVSTDLDASTWSAPSWWNLDAPLEPAVLALADRVAPSLGLEILELESVTAAALAAPMVVACVVVVRAAGVAAGAASGPEHGLARERLVVVAVVLLAVALGVSRKTAGGVALIPAATGVALVLGSALRRIAARGVWPRKHVGATSIGIHCVWLAIGLGLVSHSMPGQTGEVVRWAYFGLGLVAALLPLAVCFGDPDPPSADPGRTDPRKTPHRGS